MGNIEDYLKWRGDITFDKDPFNDVDNLILAELAYTDFGGVVSEIRGEVISLKNAYDRFFELHTEKEIMDTVMNVKVAPFLMKPMLESKRFEKTKLCAYASDTDNETQVQFAAVTFILPDGTYYVAFRGTDASIIGWKEDFNMSYLFQTPGQKRAVDYLNENFSHGRKGIRVGGHSKGGNFAIYASAFCRESIRNRIINVYSNDGPGFRDEILETDGYNTILPKIRSIVPEQTLIGMIQSNKLKHKYVKSSQKGGIMQHDAMSWQVIGNHFEEAERSAEADIMDKSFTEWLAGISDEKRERFVDILFEILMAGGANTTDEFVAGGLKNLNEVMKRMKELDEEDQRFMLDILNRFRESVSSTTYEHVVDSAKRKIKNKLRQLIEDKIKPEN